MMPVLPDYPILTDRLRLRPFRRGDVDAVFAYRQREDVARYLYDQPMTRQTCEEAVQDRIGQIAFVNEGDRIVLAAERRDDNRVIGEVSLNYRNVDAGQAEVGYIFNPEFQGFGYAAESVAALLSFAFSHLGLHRIYGRCDARNTGSFKLMERLGMRREAHFRDHELFKGEWGEELVYAILEDEWRAETGSGA